LAAAQEKGQRPQRRQYSSALQQQALTYWQQRREIGVSTRAATAQYFTIDHLGSIDEVTDTTSTVLARYGFDPLDTLSGGGDGSTICATAGLSFASPAPSALSAAMCSGGREPCNEPNPVRTRSEPNLVKEPREHPPEPREELWV
jgi:hypothetical protein